MDLDVAKDLIVDLTNENNSWRESTINLIASENVMSPLAESVYLSDFMHRYAEGDPFKRFYRGTSYIDKIEVLATDLLKGLFGAAFADVRVLSGTMANLSIYFGLASPGDTMLANGTSDGGHISHTEIGAAGCRGLRVYNYPFNTKECEIDMHGLKTLAEKHKPKIILLGNSLYLFPANVKYAKEVADKVGATLVYDAAHVLGLIAGKQFQDPLKEGADFITTSTHKTFPGPQGGLILSNNEEKFKQVKRALFPGLVCNHHLHRLPALAIASLEMKKYGEEYAKQTIKNAQALGKACYEAGMDVLAADRGFTKSHQIAIDTSAKMNGAEAAIACEKAGIILNKNLLPGEPGKNVFKPKGIRIGVQEMTRYGMIEGDMELIASLLHRVIVKKENEKHVADDAKELRSKFTEVKYCMER